MRAARHFTIAAGVAAASVAVVVVWNVAGKQAPAISTSPLQVTYDYPPGIPATVTRMKLDDPGHQTILASILRHALTSDENRVAVVLYGRKSGWVLLQSGGSPFEWPAGFEPVVPGFQFCKRLADIPAPHALGVDLRSYGPITEDDRFTAGYFAAPEGHYKVVVVLYGAKGRCLMGGQRTYYRFDPATKEFWFCGAMD